MTARKYAPGYHAPETLRLGWQGNIYDELVVDSFAGGGGASTGIELAIGRPVDIAINHDPAALAMHKANHPWTKHYCESVWEVDPREVTAGRPVGLAWFSPDCTHFSRSRGGKPKSKRIRGLAWVVLRWAATVKPRVICLENVTEFQTWGPLDAHGQPCKRREGRTFQAFHNALEYHGYRVEWRVMRAHEYGAPTTRERLFMVARCDGAPIVWPAPTHGPAPLKPVRTAGECIDWDIPGKSIFDRKKPLKPATLRRIAKGLVKFVLQNPQPYLVQVNHGGDFRGQPVSAPLPTLTSRHGHGLVIPHITKFKEHSRGSAIDQPLHTITAGGHSSRPAGTPHGMALVSAFVSKYYNGGKRGEHEVTGSFASAMDEPLHTVAANYRHHHVATAFISRMFKSGIGHTMDEPSATATAQGKKSMLVAAFLDKYNGNSSPQDASGPLDTITGRHRFGVVTVFIHGEEYVITDIHMRMLTPRELFRAQGFAENYVIAPEFKRPRGRLKTFPQDLQVRMVGNSVCPDVARAIVTANYVEQPLEMAAD